MDTQNTPCLDINDAPKRFPGFHYSDTYWEVIARSKFILCPRGYGVSSIRAFEAMSLGRVPVVISDHWQPPPGIPWDEICIRIREDDIAIIPALLNHVQGNAASMGRRARQVYDEYFAPGVFLDRLLTSLASKYNNCAFTADAVLRRAGRALGWREIRTLCHQARTLAFAPLVNPTAHDKDLVN